MLKKRALISVSDKSGLVDFAKFLEANSYELISTGGTFKHLKESGLSPIQIDAVTDFPEMLDGRVKTLHPKVHGGLLAVRSNEQHMNTVKEHEIGLIDLVIVNLYPFFAHANTDISLEDKVEFIDIGGPSMLRSGAKNFQSVAVITNVEDYALVQNEIEELGNTTLETRKKLAQPNLTGPFGEIVANNYVADETKKEIKHKEPA